MRKTKLSKLISFLLCFLMVVTSVVQFPVIAGAEEKADPQLTILGWDPDFEEGEPIEETFITEGGETTLKVDGATGDVQWQFYAEEVDTWVSIYGETKETIVLKYAKVANMLNDKDKTQIRCIQKDGDNVITSNEVDFELLPSDDGATFPLFNFVRDTEDENIAVASDESAAEGETPEFEEHTITITYELNGTTVGSPYIATVSTESGGKFSGETDVPEVVGYVPYLKTEYEGVTFNAPGEDSDKYTITLDFENVTEDINIEVGYQPGIVNYKVLHYKQNVDNDEYGVPEEEIKTGETGTTVPDVQKDYPGFYALNYNHAEIAASGGTVIEVYYDRYYYLMNFNLDGGYGVEPVYARFGAAIGDIPTPTKPGYTFQGWSDGTNMVDALPTTMQSNNVTYTAVWEANDSAKVSVVFWGENPNDEGYSYIQTGVTDATPGSNYTFADGNSVFLICGKEEHSHTTECGPNCGKTEHITHTEDCLGNCTHGKHTLECYQTRDYYTLKEATPEQTINATTDGVYSYTTGSGFNRATHNYLYLDGKWYCYYGRYSGNKSDTQSISLGCNHTHTDACYSCEEHEHSVACYSCKMEEHTHDSSCNQTGSGLDATKWKFVRSETAIVKADGSTVINVYYDRVEYTVNFYSNSNLTSEYTSYRITAKWGANILNKWPTHDGSSSWYVPNKNNTWQNSIQIMPVGGAKFYGPKTGSSSYKAYYYVEALPGEADTFVYNGVTYKLHHTDVSSSSGNVTDEERYAIEGFTYKEGTENGESYNNAKFYYTRHKYAIEFYNPTSLLKKDTGVAYQAQVKDYYWEPDSSMAPDKYEPASVEFAGWYLNPECTIAYDFDAATSTIPAGDKDGDTTLTLYAKWVPITHTVQLYTIVDDITDSSKMIGEVENIPHGTIINPIPSNPTNGNYNFVGWFYNDNGVEKAFDFNNMPIKKDMKVYGKWSSDKIMNYFVYYRVDNGDGTYTDIADKTVGSALAGTTKTFEAKASEELYEDYQSGYFPTLRSDSITMDINASQEEPTDNSLIFWYVESDPVPYTVRYLIDNGDGTYSPAFKNDDGSEYVYVNDENVKAVVTETFKVKQGYMPDAYQKRLTVVPGSEENIITFYYTRDTENAYYKISHWVEDLDGGWTEYGNGTQAPARIGTTISDEDRVLTINGHHYDNTLTEVVVGDTTTVATSGVLTDEGLELKLYYPRNEYDYLVKYVDAVTGQPLLESKLVEDKKYGETVTEKYIKIDGYDCDAEQKSHVMKVETLEEGKQPVINVITFEYTEQTVRIDYLVDGPVGCGTVDLNNVIDEKTTSVFEDGIKVINGTVKGANTEANDGYTFIGWYDADGKKLSEDTTYIPTKVDGKYVEAIYYAKFVENEVTINYVAVGPEDATNFGNVSPESETLKVLTGTAQGSTATANTPKFKFAGWYTDETCTNKISDSVHFTPKKVEGKNVAATYYAKFEWNVTSLKIAKLGILDVDNHIKDAEGHPGNEERQSTIFQVTGPDGYSQKVVVHGNSSVTIEGLVIGEYTVTEVTDWSWRYKPTATSQTITLEPPTAENVVTFSNGRENQFWLNGGAYNINNFKINK